MTENQKPIPIALAEWTDWFCRNVKDPQDFRWIHMADMADQLRSLYKQLDSQQHVLDNRLNQVIELETERDELLGALKLAKERFITKCEENLVTFNGKDVDTIEAIVKAIAKATGETK